MIQNVKNETCIVAMICNVGATQNISNDFVIDIYGASENCK